MRLTGRRVERGMMDQFVEATRAGESRALVISGEPGVGKTALLNYLAEQAAECRVLHACATGCAASRNVPAGRCPGHGI